MKETIKDFSNRYLFAKREIIPLTLILATTVLSIFYLLNLQLLPERMFINITTENTVGGFIAHIPTIAALITPVIFAFMIYWVFSFIPNSFIQVKYERSLGFLYGLKTIILTMVFVFHVLAIVFNLGIDLNNTLITVPMFSMLMIYVGFWVYRAKQDWFLGIRTPWTMRLTTVWQKTNRLGGLLLILTGLVYFVAILYTDMLFYVLFIPLAATVIITQVYSKYIYNQEIKKIPEKNLEFAKKMLKAKK